MDVATTTETMTQAQFAAYRGVSKKTVTVWKKRGLAVMTADGLVRVRETDAQLAQRPDVYRGGTVSHNRSNNNDVPPLELVMAMRYLCDLGIKRCSVDVLCQMMEAIQAARDEAA